jgi:hypothetical protein
MRSASSRFGCVLLFLAVPANANDNVSQDRQARVVNGEDATIAVRKK